jgi:hypothetical protein
VVGGRHRQRARCQAPPLPSGDGHGLLPSLFGDTISASPARHASRAQGNARRAMSSRWCSRE